MAEYDEVEIPLTRENARVGMKVICVDNEGAELCLTKYHTYEIIDLKTYVVVLLEDQKHYWWYERFILA